MGLEVSFVLFFACTLSLCVQSNLPPSHRVETSALRDRERERTVAMNGVCEFHRVHVCIVLTAFAITVYS